MAEEKNLTNSQAAQGSAPEPTRDEEQELEVVAVRSYNKKKGEWGWSALKVTPL